MQNVKLRLDTWRDAARRLHGLALGSSEWQEAEDDVRQARKVFHAEVAQVSARYAEADFQARRPWSLPALALVVCVAQGASPVFTAGIVAVSLLPMAIFFRFFMGILAEQRAEREEQGATASRP